MPEDLKIGKLKLSRTGVMIGGAAAVGILGYAYFIRRNNSGGNEEVPTGPDPNIDPSTGLPYADEFGLGFGGGGGGGAQYMGTYDPVTGQYIGSPANQTVTGFQTKAAWAQAAAAYLKQNGDYSPSAIDTALSKGLVGQPMTDAEINIFNAARAYEGEPPGGYPPLQHVPGAPAGTPGASLSAPSNVHVTNTYKTEIQVSWNSVAGAKGYAVFRAVDKPGGNNPTGQRQTTSTYNSYQFKGLSPGTTYRFDIRAVGTDNNLGKTATIFATTKKK